MELVGIHDLDALHCFSGITHCPRCGKEGQNKGTMVNHLQMVHYRLGLVCNRCPDCSSTMANTLPPQLAGLLPTQERKILMSQFHLSNHQKKQNLLSWGSKQGGQDGMFYPRLPYWEYPYPPLQPWKRTSR